MPIHQGWFTALYTLHLLDSQSFEFEICILLALQMPLIRCTNVFYQERLSRHITSPTEKPRPESWPGDYMDKAVVIIPPLPPNVTNNRAEQQLTPSVEKTCPSTKGGLLRYIHYTYSEFAICILLAVQMPLIRCTNVFYQERLPRHIYYVRFTSILHPSRFH